MTRPGVLVGVCGTGTEVGKTWFGARVLERLRLDGRAVAARKPLQSFDPDDPGPSDAEVLAAATGEDPHDVCPADGWYAVPMAPPMAADVLGRPCPSLAEVVGAITWPDACDVGLVESVGGVRSPLATDGDSRDLVRALGVDVVLLVADAGLGTIDAVRAAVDALSPVRIVTVLNRYDDGDDLHRRNRAWLTTVDGFDVVVDPAGAVSRLGG